MTDWKDTLYAELDQWNFDGVPATFWWRDDDAQSPSTELEQLVNLAKKYTIPLALAVIPEGMTQELATYVKPIREVTILQHGFAHTNHAPPTEKKAELGDHRKLTIIHDELVRGFSVLHQNFAKQFIPVLVPPWNRITPRLLEELTKSGFAGLSTFEARDQLEVTPGIIAVNTHADIINWKQNKKFIGAQQVADAIVSHLRNRRLGEVDSAEPTGLLTHHLVHDAECWDFLAQLFAALDEHPAVKWHTAKFIFRIE